MICRSTPANTWTTSASNPNQNIYIPNTYHQLFQLNVWQAFWTHQKPQATQVVVTNFQYKPTA